MRDMSLQGQQSTLPMNTMTGAAGLKSGGVHVVSDNFHVMAVWHLIEHPPNCNRRSQSLPGLRVTVMLRPIPRNPQLSTRLAFCELKKSEQGLI